MMKRALKLNQRSRQDNTDFDPDFEETDLKNRHLRRHSSPRVDTYSGLHSPRIEDIEQEWKTS